MELIYCACNCGNTLTKFSKWGYERKFIHGHNLKDKFGEKHPLWTGGRVMDSYGYVLLYKPDHPFANNHGYVREHRLVVEEHLGRYLKDDEIVHHKNEDRQDNRLENLQIMTRDKHNTHHNKFDMSDRLCVLCGNKTRIEKNANGRFYEHWHKLGDKFICQKCSSYRRNVLKL